MQPTPVMTTKNTLLNKTVETVQQPSVNSFDTSGLGDVGSEPVLKTVESGTISGVQANAPQTVEMPVIASGRVTVKPIMPATVDDFMSDSIVARPLRLPNYLDVRCSDPNWIPRWVNYKTQNGARYSMFKSAGFRNAKAAEIVGLSEELQVGTDGTIKDHDVVLMVAPKSIVYGAYKQNALTSMRNLGMGAMQKAKEESDRVIRQGISSEGFNYGEYGKKLVSYIPDANELNESGRFNK